MFWTNHPILKEARKRKEHEEKMKNDNSIQRPIERIINDLEEASILSRNMTKEDSKKVEQILKEAVPMINQVLNDISKIQRKGNSDE
jgi:hypothetical protein